MYHHYTNKKPTSKAAAASLKPSTLELTSYLSQSIISNISTSWIRWWPDSDQFLEPRDRKSCSSQQKDSSSLQTINLDEEELDDAVPALDDSLATTLTLSHTSSFFCGDSPGKCNRLDAEITQMDVIRMGRAAAEYFDVKSTTMARLPIIKYDIIEEKRDDSSIGCKPNDSCWTELDTSFPLSEEHSDHCHNRGVCLICSQQFSPTDYVRMLPGPCQRYIVSPDLFGHTCLFMVYLPYSTTSHTHTPTLPSMIRANWLTQHIGCIERLASASHHLSNDVQLMNVVDETPPRMQPPPQAQAPVIADESSSSSSPPPSNGRLGGAITSTSTSSSVQKKEPSPMMGETDSDSSMIASWTFVKIGSSLESDQDETTTTTSNDSDSIIPQWSFLQVGEALESQEHCYLPET